ERAYMLLRMNGGGGEGSNYGSSDEGSYEYDEEGEEDYEEELELSLVEHEEDHEAWQEVDPDEYSYEELVALGEVVGTENRGLSADTLASLPSVTYKLQHVQDGNTEQCVICRVELEDESLCD
ncbi:hypothetical protein ACJX0J_029229, partial [Zea mays]